MGVNTREAGVVTEPECLGPCEPGTSVNLEGIVWHETEEGKKLGLFSTQSFFSHWHFNCNV